MSRQPPSKTRATREPPRDSLALRPQAPPGETAPAVTTPAGR